MNWKKIFSKNRRHFQPNREIAPDEIFLDSSNLPSFDTFQLEGRIEKPISKSIIVYLAIFFLFVGFLFSLKIWNLQVKKGEIYKNLSSANTLRYNIIFSNRGIILDRNKIALAWNEPSQTGSDFLFRKYVQIPGIFHIIGYLKYPIKDKAGFYFSDKFDGKDGVEKYWNETLLGKNGLKIIEVNAKGSVVSENTIHHSKQGENITLTIDSKIQSKLYELMGELANKIGFTGGSGVIMDSNNGEVLVLTSYPECNSQLLTDGIDTKSINKCLNNKNNPFLNKAVSGLYTPGSIVKPFIALAALSEKIISPTKTILSTGSIEVTSPYDPKKKYIYTDYKARGWVDMKQALALSSNIYFYEVGGGFEGQKGLGINNIEKYMRLFGFGGNVGKDFFEGLKGTIPNPKWKEENFHGDPWRVGDTYFTAIGQYGFQVTPMQMARGMAAIANNGKLLNPVLVKTDDSPVFLKIDLDKKDFEIVKEGLRQAVTTGLSTGLNIPQVEVAAKTGTAELGVLKNRVNSWIVGFFPYKNPKYTFAVLMENGPSGNFGSSLLVMRELFDWMVVNTPDYLKE